MKRKLVMLLTIVAVLAVGIGIWYNVPINLMDLEHDEVIEIVVFNGNTGNATHITDETQIEHIIENLNEIKLKRSKPSVGYSGYSFKMTIYLSDGNEADDWNNFIINSDDTIRVADGLFCREIDGLFCRSSPDIIVRRRCVLSHKRRGWLQPSPSFRYSRNLALQDELYHPVINNGPAVLVCVDKRLGTGPVNQSRDAG